MSKQVGSFNSFISVIALLFIGYHHFYYLPNADISSRGYYKLNEMKSHKYERGVEAECIHNMIKNRESDDKITQKEFDEIKYMYEEILEAERLREEHRKELENARSRSKQ